jgi:hypothetical protein
VKAFVELRQSFVPAIDEVDVFCHYTSKDIVSEDDVEQYTICSVAADMKDFSNTNMTARTLYLFEHAILIEGCDQILVLLTAL